MRKCSLSLLLAISVWSSSSRLTSDAPPEPPGDVTVCSPGGSHCAFVEYKSETIAVWRVLKKPPHRKLEKLWEMPGWFRNVSLTEDGRNLIVAYRGSNLLDPDFIPDEVMLSFYHEGKKTREIVLKQLLENPAQSALEKTESHYRWCQGYGLDDKGRYVVNTTENRQFLFNPDTGQSVKGKLFGS